MQYELFYLIGASKETELEKIKSEVEKIVTDNGGKFLEKNTIEKRKLSYAIKHENHGVYIARRFELEEGKILKEIISKLNLYGDVLRFIISKAEDLPELKSKEERIAEAEKKEKNSKNREREDLKKEAIKTKKVFPKTKEKEEKKEEEKNTESKNEDIDKKLEEILNI